MQFACLDGDDDYGEMWLKVINGRRLLASELPPKLHIDQLLGNQTRSVLELMTASDQLTT